MITDQQLTELKEAAEKVRDCTANPSYTSARTIAEYEFNGVANPATVLSLIEQLEKFKEQFDLLDDPDGLYTEIRGQIRDGALEEAAKVASKVATSNRNRAIEGDDSEFVWLSRAAGAEGAVAAVRAIKSTTLETK